MQKFLHISPDITDIPNRYGNEVDWDIFSPVEAPPNYWSFSRRTLGLSMRGGVSFHNYNWNVDMGLQLSLRGYSNAASFNPGLGFDTDTLLENHVYNYAALLELPVMVDHICRIGKVRVYLGGGGSIGIRLRDIYYSKNIYQELGVDHNIRFTDWSTFVVGSAKARAGVEFILPSGDRLRVGPHYDLHRGIPFYHGMYANNWKAVGLELGYYWGKQEPVKR